MSRIGRAPITVPAGVTVTIGDANVVTVKGPLGTLTQQFNANMQLSLDAGVLTVVRPDDEAENRSLHGLTRTLLNNMVVGVSSGYAKTLQIVGVGYRVALQGKKLVMNLGHSHPIEVEAPEGITFEVPDSNTIIVKGYDKQVVGQTAAVIRSYRKPEPYHGKGVKYADEVVRRKAGKAGGKGK
ncbi:MAG: 50S ribosomal protein L6 [Clostridia bacterium]|nr:50S ribosomal protein L6 [Clostridia bacterium]